MPKLTIDYKEVEVEPGNMVLHAARKLGIDIPTLCFNEECQPSTSCMVCVVKANNRIVPSCATVAGDGMQIESETDEIHEARRTALELLLSDHLGDCIAPCHRTCPAGMNIPLMIRQIADGKSQDAIATVKRDIALPAVLGRICPAPCENACRRRAYDSPVSICLLKRYAADVDLMSESPYLPSCKPGNGKRVAIVGAGPTSLAAAYYLLQEGYGCVIFDDHEKPGGMLQYAVPEDKLPRKVLDAEIGLIEKLGAEFRMKTRIGEHISVPDLRSDYDAVLIATGGDDNGLGIQFQVNKTLQTNLEGVFAGGNATGRKSKMAVRSVADGKTAAASIDQYISGLPVTGPRKPFSVYIGRLAEGEIQRFITGVSEGQRVSPSGGEEAGLSNQEAHTEAIRCLHCDCRKADNCKLRDYSEVYGANPNRYKGERKLFEQYIQDSRPTPNSSHSANREGEAPAEPCVIYEPGKCIKCGLCIQITSNSSEALGLTFIGRGFDVRVGIPFSGAIEEGLRKVAAQCIATCPTGALASK
jgi:ferredoxin